MNCLDATLLYQLDETRALLASLGSLSRITAKAIFTSIKRVCLGESPLSFMGVLPTWLKKDVQFCQPAFDLQNTIVEGSRACANRCALSALSARLKAGQETSALPSCGSGEFEVS